VRIVGKPYSGKPNVRFDEGELEIELSATTPALYSTVSHNFDIFRRSETCIARFLPELLKASIQVALLDFQ